MKTAKPRIPSPRTGAMIFIFHFAFGRFFACSLSLYLTLYAAQSLFCTPRALNFICFCFFSIRSRLIWIVCVFWYFVSLFQCISQSCIRQKNKKKKKNSYKKNRFRSIAIFIIVFVVTVVLFIDAFDFIDFPIEH